MSDIATMIVDLLRKKEEEKAVHAGEGHAMTPEQAAMLLKSQSEPMRPNPDMLGAGVAQKAGHLLDNRKAQIEAALAAAGQ